MTEPPAAPTSPSADDAPAACPSLRDTGPKYDPPPFSNLAAILTINLVIVGFLFIYSLFYFRKDWMELSDAVAKLTPIFMDLNLAVIVMSLVLNRRGLIELLRTISRRAWVGVGIIALASYLLLAFVAPRTHRIYYDEDIYGNIGLSISERNVVLMTTEAQWRDGIFYLHRGEMNKQPNGLPYVLSLVYRLLGPGHDISYLPNNLALPAMVVTVFLIAVILFGKQNLALYAALIFATVPNNYRWFSTMATEPLAALTAGLTVLCALFYCLRPGLDRVVLLASVAAFAVQFRIETMMIGLVVLMIVALWRRKEFVANRLYVGGVIFFYLIPHHLAHVESVKHQDWGAVKGSKFSLAYAWRESEPYDMRTKVFDVPASIVDAWRTGKWKQGNLYQNVRFLFFDDQRRFPKAYAWLFLLGIILGGPLRLYSDWDGTRFRDSAKGLVVEAPWKAKGVALAWFALFWGIFLFFYAGSYYYGADDRFSLLCFAPLALIVAVGVEALERMLNRWGTTRAAQTFLACVLVLLFSRYVRVVRGVHHEAWLARYAHDWAVERMQELPENSMVITHIPSVFNLHGVGGIQMAVGANEPKRVEHFIDTVQGGVYLYWGFWSVVPDEVSHDHAVRARDNFDCEETHQKTLGHATSEYKYTVRFYKVRKKTRAAPEETEGEAGEAEGAPGSEGEVPQTETGPGGEAGPGSEKADEPAAPGPGPQEPALGDEDELRAEPDPMPQQEE